MNNNIKGDINNIELIDFLLFIAPDGVHVKKDGIYFKIYDYKFCITKFGDVMEISRLVNVENRPTGLFGLFSKKKKTIEVQQRKITVRNNEEIHEAILILLKD